MNALAVALLLASVPSVTQSGTSAATDRGATEQAKVHFRLGSRLFKQGHYRDAAAEFEAARRLRPHGYVFYNLAQCHERMGEPSTALSYYREYLRAMPDAKDRSAVQAAMAKLEARLGASGVQQLFVKSEPAGAEVYVDGKLHGRTPLATTLPVGRHALALSMPGYAELRREAVLTAHRPADVDVALARSCSHASVAYPGGPAICSDLPAPLAAGPVSTATVPSEGIATGPPPEVSSVSRPRVWTWVATGVAGAALVTGVVYGLAARSASDELRSAAHNGPAAQRLADTASSQARTANVFYGIAAGAGAAGVTLFFVEGRF